MSTLRAYPKTCFAYPSASERIIGKAREAGVSSGYVDAAERSIGFVQPREVQMRFSDRLLVGKRTYDGIFVQIKALFGFDAAHRARKGTQIWAKRAHDAF